MKTIYKHQLIGIALLFLSLSSLMAQTVEGWVYDQNSPNVPLIGVNIFWSETTHGTSSDANGYFKLTPHHDNNTLIFSYVGYQTDSVKITGKSPIKVQLKPGTNLSEVNVVERVNSTNISKINPILTQNITSKELTKFACCNLSESFETNASVDVAYADAVSGIKQIKMLGLSGRYSQIMVENVPILRGSESAFGLDYVPGTWMQSIQVSKGTSAVKNGYESITGQINVIFKNPDDNEKMHFYVYGNQDGKIESNAGASFKVNENWGTSVLVHGGSSIRELDMNKDGFLDKPLAKTGNVMSRWNYAGKKTEAKLGISFLTESRQGGQTAYNHDIARENQPDYYGINIDITRLNAFSKIGYLLERPNTSLGWISSANYFKRSSFYGNYTLDVDQLNLYTNLMYQSYLGNSKHTYTTGISAVYDNNSEFFDATNVGFEEFVPGVFFEYNYIPSEQLSLLLGIRNDYSNLHGNFITPRAHFKYHFPAYTTVRLSAGKGYRSPLLISENTQFLASSRTFIIENSSIQEEAWNYGISATNEISIGMREATLAFEFFRTDFKNQLIVDLYRNPQEIYFYNLDGKSYANSFQIEAFYELFNRFDINTGIRWNDVKATYNTTLKETPFVSNYKALISTQYRTRLDKWQFDMTLQFHGSQQLTSLNNELGEPLPGRSNEYINLIAQATKNYRYWSFYVGAENLTNFTQENAIIDVENPFGDSFDASQIWGPLYGRMFYAGIKYNLNK
jgi:outer membrane receptor for ferrienterochelin and colicin